MKQGPQTTSQKKVAVKKKPPVPAPAAPKAAKTPPSSLAQTQTVVSQSAPKPAGQREQQSVLAPDLQPVVKPIPQIPNQSGQQPPDQADPPLNPQVDAKPTSQEEKMAVPQEAPAEVSNDQTMPQGIHIIPIEQAKSNSECDPRTERLQEDIDRLTEVPQDQREVTLGWNPTNAEVHNVIIDGAIHHAAALANGEKTIRARYFSIEDVKTGLLEGVRRNAKHGTPLNEKDRDADILRLKDHFTQDVIARAFGVTQPTIHRWIEKAVAAKAEAEAKTQATSVQSTSSEEELSSQNTKKSPWKKSLNQGAKELESGLEAADDGNFLAKLLKRIEKIQRKIQAKIEAINALPKNASNCEADQESSNSESLPEGEETSNDLDTNDDVEAEALPAQAESTQMSEVATA